MSLFTALQSAFSERRAVTTVRNDYSSTDTFDFSESEGVTTRRVAGYPPVSQALQMISGDCAKLPLQVVKVIPDGVEVVPDHPILSLISLWGPPTKSIPPTTCCGIGSSIVCSGKVCNLD